MENVPPLRDQGVFRDFVDSLTAYHVDYSIVDGRMVGLPQTRRRLVLVASMLGPVKLPLRRSEYGPCDNRKAALT